MLTAEASKAASVVAQNVKLQTELDLDFPLVNSPLIETAEIPGSVGLPNTKADKNRIGRSIKIFII